MGITMFSKRCQRKIGILNLLYNELFYGKHEELFADLCNIVCYVGISNLKRSLTAFPFKNGTLCDIDLFVYDSEDKPYVLQQPPVLEITTSSYKIDLPDISPIDRKLPPVLLIPGFAGSLLDVTIDEDQEMPLCLDHITTNNSRLWLDTYFFLPIRRPRAVECFYEKMALNWDKRTNEYRNHRGVTVNPVEHAGSGLNGGIIGCDYLARLFGRKMVSYFGKLIEGLEKKGYRRGINLFAAPYDWRIPITSNAEYLNMLRIFIEYIHLEYQQPVVIAGHSMGNLVANYFLEDQSPEWKREYIRSMVSVAAPWGGASKALREVLSGDTVIGGHWYQKIFGIFNREKVAKLFRNFGSLYMMFPSKKAWGDTELVYFEEDNKIFKAGELEDLLVYLGLDPDIYKSTRHVLENIKAPGVPLYCFNGRGLVTETQYAYATKDTSNQPVVYCSEGDGTVPATSYRLCDSDEWRRSNAGFPIYYKEIFGQEHTGILQDDDFILNVLDLLNELALR